MYIKVMVDEIVLCMVQVIYSSINCIKKLVKNILNYYFELCNLIFWWNLDGDINYLLFLERKFLKIFVGKSKI